LKETFTLFIDPLIISPSKSKLIKTFLSHSMQNEWVVESRCTHHMNKDSSLFTSLNKVEERNIYVVNDFCLNIVGQGDVSC
jgi:hypothetical protein